MLLLLLAGTADASIKILKPGSPPPVRYIVAFEGDAPALGAGARFHGATVVSRDPSLDWLVVETRHPQALLPALAAVGDVRFVEEDRPDAIQALWTPNDPRYGEQHGLAGIRAAQAWDVTRGSTSVVVAVLDSGVDVAHPDLGRFTTGADTTGSGTIADGCGHGTHVTGTAAATTNNGRGVAGVAQSLVMPVKVIRNSCSGSFSQVANGIVWAADRGADVITMSLGCRGCYSSAVADAVKHAVNARGALVIAAAGNSGCSGCVYFPATLPEVLAVACTTASDATCSFSSRGNEVDLAAPGESILSTETGNRYGTRSGTSMSAPHVAGAAALLMTQHPGWSAGQVRERLLATARDVGAPGWDPATGAGVLDVAAALGTAATPPPASGPAPAPPPPPPGARLDEAFDDGAADGWSLSGLWRVAGDCLGSKSPARSLQYTRAGACDYDPGGRTTGVAEVGVDLAGAASPRLTFATRYTVESYGFEAYDRLSVLVSANGGASWTTLWEKSSRDAAASSWQTVALDLSAHASSSTRLRFVFDSVDGLQNRNPGWAVDDVLVT